MDAPQGINLLHILQEVRSIGKTRNQLINNRGQVIGATYTSDGTPQFFLYEDGQYWVVTGLPANILDANDLSIVHGPGAWGLNDRGEIAVTYVQRIPCE